MPKKKNIWISIVAGIFLAIMLVVTTHFGIKVFYAEPDYPRYDCVYDPNDEEKCNISQEEYLAYESDMDKYNQNVFYVLAFVGIIFIIIGLVWNNLIAQISGIGAGFVSIIMGMIRNSDSNVTVFITSIVVIILIAGVLYRFRKKIKIF